MPMESPSEALLLNEDTFYEFFVPYRHPKAKAALWNGIGLSSFGDDFQLIRSLDDNYVWTVVDSGCNSDQ